jgi:hypothetical protein
LEPPNSQNHRKTTYRNHRNHRNKPDHQQQYDTKKYTLEPSQPHKIQIIHSFIPSADFRGQTSNFLLPSSYFLVPSPLVPAPQHLSSLHFYRTLHHLSSLSYHYNTTTTHCISPSHPFGRSYRSSREESQEEIRCKFILHLALLSLVLLHPVLQQLFRAERDSPSSFVPRYLPTYLFTTYHLLQPSTSTYSHSHSHSHSPSSSIFAFCTRLDFTQPYYITLAAG